MTTNKRLWEDLELKGGWLSKAYYHIQRHLKGEKGHSETVWTNEDLEQGIAELRGEQRCWICQVAKEIPYSKWFGCHSRSFQKYLVVEGLG